MLNTGVPFCLQIWQTIDLPFRLFRVLMRVLGDFVERACGDHKSHSFALHSRERPSLNPLSKTIQIQIQTKTQNNPYSKSSVHSRSSGCPCASASVFRPPLLINRLDESKMERLGCSQEGGLSVRHRPRRPRQSSANTLPFGWSCRWPASRPVGLYKRLRMGMPRASLMSAVAVWVSCGSHAWL